MLNVLIGAQTKEFEKAMRRSETKLDQFQKSINRLPGLIGGAFAVGSIVSFTTEATKLAGVAEGVEKAFRGIDGSNLDRLRAATKGTVNDLELMQAAVNARNFEIPFQKLGSLFEFATQRAADTGQEVNDLVRDIITGLGRKSPFILDNLGISAVKLKEKLGGVGLQSATTADITKALTGVIDEQNKAFGNTGNTALTAGQKIQAFQTNIDNLKLSLGKLVADSGIIDFLGGIANGLNDLATQGVFNRNAFMDSLIAEEKQQQKNLSIQKQVNHILEQYKGKEEEYLKAAKDNVNIDEIRAGVMAVLNKRREDALAKQEKLNALTQNQQKSVEELNAALVKINANEGIRGFDRMIEASYTDLILSVNNALLGSNIQLKTMSTNLVDVAEDVSLLDGAFEALGGNMVSVFNNMLSSGKIGIEGIINMLKQMIAKLIAAAAAAAVLSALLPGGKGRLKGAFTFGEKFKQLFSGRGFADGGNPPIGKFSVVGERGPELIKPRGAMTVVPNHKIGSFGSMAKSMAIRLTGQFRIVGNDLVYVLDQTNRINGRFSG